MQFLAVLAIGLNSLTGSLSNKDPFTEQMHSKVIETLENSPSIPGLKSEKFQDYKRDIAIRWNELVSQGVLEVTATDEEVRPYFVALQGVIEHVLAGELNKSIKSLTGVIHTPMPATPLCTEGNVSPELVHPFIAEDPLRTFTVKARTTILRDYLLQGADLYVAYPKEGINKRTEEQKQIYKKELDSYPSHLFDCALDCVSIDSNLIGAFYLFETMEGKLFAFAIKMTQASSPQDLGNFGLWFGEVTQQPVQKRILDVLNGVLKYSPQLIPLGSIDIH